MRVSLRPATPEDAPLLRRWDAQPHVRAGVPDHYTDWDAELQLPDWQQNFIAEDAGRPVGFIRIIDPAREETRYWGDVPAGLRALDIWVGEAGDLGCGYGTEMMQRALDVCFSDPEVNAVVLDPLASNTRAHRFYERLGFRLVERRVFGADDCLVYRLERNIWRSAV